MIANQVLWQKILSPVCNEINQTKVTESLTQQMFQVVYQIQL